MVRRLLSMILLVVMCLSFGFDVLHAQENALQGSELDEDEQAALEYVMQAMENMTALETLRSTTEQTTNEHFNAEGMTVNVSSYQIIDSAYDNSGDDVRLSISNAQTIITEVGGQKEEIEMTVDMIALEDTLWVRVYDTNSPSLSTIFPSEWINVKEDPTQIPGLELLNVELLLLMTNTWEAYPLTEKTVEAIEELDANELDGVEMRVFAIHYSSRGLLNTGLTTQIGQVFNADVMGANMESWMQQLMEGSAIDMTVWIGSKDSLLYRAEVRIVVDATVEDVVPNISALGVQQDFKALYDYHSFNEPLEITAPETDE